MMAGLGTTLPTLPQIPALAEEQEGANCESSEIRKDNDGWQMMMIAYLSKKDQWIQKGMSIEE